jgi:hypothetical protein
VQEDDPRAECGGCLHAGVFGPGSGYEFRESESKPGAGAGKPGNLRSAAENHLGRSTLSGIHALKNSFDRPAVVLTSGKTLRSGSLLIMGARRASL